MLEMENHHDEDAVIEMTLSEVVLSLEECAWLSDVEKVLDDIHIQCNQLQDEETKKVRRAKRVMRGEVKSLLDSVRERHLALHERVPHWKSAVSAAQVGHKVKIHEMRVADKGMKLLHLTRIVSGMKKNPKEVAGVHHNNDEETQELQKTCHAETRHVETRHTEAHAEDVVTLQSKEETKVLETIESSGDQKAVGERDERSEVKSEVTPNTLNTPSPSFKPATPITAPTMHCTYETRIKFQHLGDERIRKLFQKGNANHLPETVLWHLFQSLRVPRLLFQQIFLELKLVDHDKSDDSDGRVELEDFLRWIHSDQKEGVVGEDDKHDAKAMPHLDLESMENIANKQERRKEKKEKERRKKKKERKNRKKHWEKHQTMLSLMLAPNNYAKQNHEDVQHVIELNKCTCPTQETTVSKKVKQAFDEIVTTVILSLEVPDSSLFSTFSTFDLDGNGELSLSEFKDLLDLLEIGVEETFSWEENKSLFDLFDRNGDGEICFDDFEQALYPSMLKNLKMNKKK